jgi:tetratricopeptide (TPR) repeat protein
MLSEQQHRIDEIGSFLRVSAAETLQSVASEKISSIQNEDDLEKEYIQLMQELRMLPKLQTRAPSPRIEKLIGLVKVSLKLQLPEQAEIFLQDAFAYAFGSQNGDYLSLPKTPRRGLPSALVIELMLTRAQFHFYLYDYAAAARCFAELMQWLESNELMCIDSEKEANVFIGSFITLMQRADLYAAARILIKQAIEFEEYGEIRRALKTYDKALLLSEQLFPNNHLEIAQLLQLKSAALRLSGKKSESHTVAKRAAEIEAFAGEAAQLAENRLRRLPKYDFRHPGLGNRHEAL